MSVRIPVGSTFALVDPADEALVAGLSWHVCGGYARHGRRIGPRKENRVEHVWMHRLILGLGSWKVDRLEVDHENGNGLDNRRSNLVVCTRARNMQNRRSGYGSSQHRGVHRRANGRWLAQGSIGGKKVHIGLYDDELEAAAAARAWRIEHMGEHAA